jgi:predicted  nucleic acid-binding Zn-ribbon protein
MSDEPLTDARNLNAKAYDLYIRGELDKLVFKIARERDEAQKRADHFQHERDTARRELELIRQALRELKRYDLSTQYETTLNPKCSLVFWVDIEDILK